MALQYNQQTGYIWSNPSPRPAKPQAFSRNLFDRFVESRYAQETTLAEFCLSHPNAGANGVLNQLHRRHVISWDLIKRFVAKSAATNPNKEMEALFREVFVFFNNGPAAYNAFRLPHGQNRATAWGQIANDMCWQDANVFVGPSAGNNGVALDQADELNDQERRDILMGAAWQTAGRINASMLGFV